MGMIPRVSQRKKDVKISKSVVGEGQRREESRWRTRWEKARGHVGFFNGNSWVPDWGVQAGWSNSEARNSKLVVSGLNSHTEMFLRSMRYYTNIWAHILKLEDSDFGFLWKMIWPGTTELKLLNGNDFLEVSSSCCLWLQPVPHMNTQPYPTTSLTYIPCLKLVTPALGAL